MDSWRKQGVNFNQDATRTRSNSYRKPPLGGSSNWQQSVPSWEKKFCASVGTIPWRKFVEMKRFVHLYDNINKWNDSAAEEAFRNAKNRFYANMHGLPCDIALPDPDTYIDEIDWNSQVDPNLILDLESDPVVPDANSNGEQVVIFGDDFPPSYQDFSPYGWGDSDEDKKKDANANTSPENNAFPWDEGKEWGTVDSNNNNWWGWNENDDKAKGDPGWGWNMYDNNNYFYGDVNNGKREGSGRYMSRDKTSRFRGDDNRRSHSRRNNGNARKSTAPGPWKSNYYCTPVSANSPGRAADGWSVKKPVS